MRIAIISSGFLPVVDGVTVALYQRLRVLSKLGHEVLVLCPDYAPIKTVYPHWHDYQGEILPGVRVAGLPSESFMGIAFERNISRRAIEPLQRELEVFAPDVVHVDEPDRLFLGMLKAPGVDYARANNVPCVGFYHTNFIDYIEDFLPLPKVVNAFLQWFSMLFIRPVFHAYDATLVSSPAAEDRLHQLKVRNVLRDRFLGVDLAAFQTQTRQPDFFKSQYGIDGLENKIKLVFLGRLTPDKGWKFTLRALADWSKRNEQLRDQVAIVIAGDGELREEIETELRSLNLNAHLLGRILPEAVPALLVNSDIHITTSEKETLGLTILEAFAAGIPAIAPNAGGVTTLIRSGENGLLFEPQNVESFGLALTALAENNTLRQKMGQQGQQDVEPYQWETVVSNLIDTWKAQIASCS